MIVSLTIILLFSGFAYSNEVGNASWYGDAFHGRKTASGETFNMYDYTAAHMEYEFGTKVKVTNLENDKSVIVRINDRGPYVSNRLIDLSKKAFADIGSLDEGLIRVKIEVVSESSEEGNIDNDSDIDNDNDIGSYDNQDYQGSDDDRVLYRLQFGAFAIRENAVKFATELIEQGIMVKVYKVRYDTGKILYKVVSSEKFKDIESAKIKAKKYKRMGLDCFPVLIKV